MFQNNNEEVVKELAKENFKTHKTRNMVAILAIFLTTMLITTVLTAGISLISTGSNAGEQTPGPSSDGYLTGNYEHFQKIEAMGQIEWADYVQKCSRVALRNDVFSAVETRLLAPDENFYRDNLIVLKTGNYPSKEEDILISDTTAKALGIEEKAGQPFTLSVMVNIDGKEQQRDIPMNICGIYKNPLFVISSIYDEIYTSPEFIPAYNPGINADDHIIYVKLNNLNALMLKTDVSLKLSEVADAAGALGYSAGKNSGVFTTSFFAVLPSVLFVLLLMASGYFLIYNVFYISITSDIRWFGMMKTIGTTKSQLKSILNRQVRILSATGIILGMIAGYLMGLVVSPRIVGMTDWAVYYKAPNFLVIGVFTVIFSYITVKISARKPFKVAANVSPVEAQRYTPKSNKNIFTVISLALSGIIFIAAANVSIGFDEQIYTDRYNQNDYQINHKGTIWSLEEPYIPIAPEMVSELGKLSFVEQVDTIYAARTNQTNGESVQYYPGSAGEIKPEGKLWNLYANLFDLKREVPQEELIGSIPGVNDRGNLTLSIAGINGNRFATEQANYELMEGVWDTEAFNSGEYLIYFEHNFDNYIKKAELGKESETEKIHEGDRIKLSFYDDVTGSYVEREFKVLAVIKMAYEYTSSDFSSANILISDQVFKEIYPNYQDRISGIQITVKEDLKEVQIKEIQKLMQSYHNNQLITHSRYETAINAATTKQTYGMIGFFLAGVLAIIGISNVINTVTANVLAHRLEYAAMQSVGMTKKQLIRLLFSEGGKYCWLSLAVMLPMGGYVAYMLAESPMFTGFNVGLFISSALLILLIMTAICMTISISMVRLMNRKSIVERLRESA